MKKVGLTIGIRHGIIGAGINACHLSESETVPVGLPTLKKVTVAVASSVNPQGSVNLFPSLMLCKGEVML